MRRMLFGAVAASVLALGAAEPVITVDAKADRGPGPGAGIRAQR